MRWAVAIDLVLILLLTLSYLGSARLVSRPWGAFGLTGLGLLALLALTPWLVARWRNIAPAAFLGSPFWSMMAGFLAFGLFCGLFVGIMATGKAKTPGEASLVFFSVLGGFVGLAALLGIPPALLVGTPAGFLPRAALGFAWAVGLAIVSSTAGEALFAAVLFLLRR